MGTISITFDTDHMSEASMRAFLEGVDIPGAATFFCTQRYESLSAEQDVHEVGIHPVLDNTIDWGSYSGALRDACEGGSSLVGARAHSLAYKQQYGVWLANNGFDYVSQTTLYYQSRIAPYWHPWGLWELPIYYQDNADMDMAKTMPGFEVLNEAWLNKATNEEGLYVFAFHPVHIMLNSFEPEIYAGWRQAGNPDLTSFDRRKPRGIGSYFDRLLALMRSSGLESQTLASLVPKQPIIEDWIGQAEMHSAV
jgi:hypothetical protein